MNCGKYSYVCGLPGVSSSAQFSMCTPNIKHHAKNEPKGKNSAGVQAHPAILSRIILCIGLIKLQCVLQEIPLNE
jgi:hypothetical protein